MSDSVRLTKVYRNRDVLRIVGLIPEGHSHIRLVLELNDQTIVLQEATVAAIVRAYVTISTHPTRRAVELLNIKLGSGSKKVGYSEYQLIESSRTEEEILSEWAEKLYGESTGRKDHNP